MESWALELYVYHLVPGFPRVEVGLAWYIFLDLERPTQPSLYFIKYPREPWDQVYAES